VVTYVLEAGCRPRFSKPKFAPWGRPPRAGVAIAGGDTKVVEHGKADRMYITTAGIGRTPGVKLSPHRSGRRQGAALGPLAITASPSCWRAESSIWKPTCAPIRDPFSAGGGIGWPRARHSLDARSYSRRRRYLAERTGARLRSQRAAFRRTESPSATRARRLRTAGAGSAAYRQRRAVPGGGRRPNTRTPASRACARRPADTKPQIIGEIREQPAATVLGTRATEARG
jgi:hypothetical protein